MYLKDFTLSLIFTIFLYYVIAQNVDSIWNQLYIDIDPINYLILIKRVIIQDQKLQIMVD